MNLPTIKELMELWPLFAFLTSLIFGGTMLFLHSKFMPRKGCRECREKIEAQQAVLSNEIRAASGRQQALASLLQNLPTAMDMHALALELSDIAGEMKRLNEEIKAVRREQGHLREQFRDLLDAHLVTAAGHQEKR